MRLALAFALTIAVVGVSAILTAETLAAQVRAVYESLATILEGMR